MKNKVTYVYENEIHKAYRTSHLVRSAVKLSVLCESSYVLYLKDNGMCEIIKSRRNHQNVLEIIRKINDQISYLKEMAIFLEVKNEIDYMAYFKESFESEVRKLEVEHVSDIFYDYRFEFDIITK